MLIWLRVSLIGAASYPELVVRCATLPPLTRVILHYIPPGLKHVELVIAASVPLYYPAKPDSRSLPLVFFASPISLPVHLFQLFRNGTLPAATTAGDLWS